MRDIPGVDLQKLLGSRIEPLRDRLPAPKVDFLSEQKCFLVLSLWKRLKDENDSRRLEIKKDGEDTVAINGAEIVLSEELEALIEVSRSIGGLL